MALNLRWVWTNTWAIPTALAIHSMVGQLSGLGDAQVTSGVIDAILSIAVGGPIIGGLVGWAQARVVVQRLGSVNLRRWVGLTIAGAALVLAAGAVTTNLGLTVHFATVDGDADLAAVERTWSAVFLTQITGFLIGLLLGGPQSWALPAPRHLRFGWVAANGAGWSLGMLLTALSVGFLDSDADLRVIFAALFAGLALTGASVGFFTGLVLRKLAAP